MIQTPLSAVQQVGGDVVIIYDGNNSIALHDVSMANLHANDFLFVREKVL